MHDYIVKSNREGGTGRSDIYIKSVLKTGIAIVIEFKIAKDIYDLEKSCQLLFDSTRLNIRLN